MFKYFVLICVILLAMPVQASEHTLSVDRFSTVKATINIGDINVTFIANEASASAVVKIVSK